MARHTQITKNNKFAIFMQYLMKEVSNEVDFFSCTYKLILWFLIGMVKHCQISQNSKFAMSLQYLIKEVRDEVDILHAYKQKFSASWFQNSGRQHFLQGDSNIIDGQDQAFSKYCK